MLFALFSSMAKKDIYDLQYIPHKFYSMFLVLKAPTLNQFLLANDDFITKWSLFVIFQNQKISPANFMFLQKWLTFHFNLETYLFEPHACIVGLWLTNYILNFDHFHVVFMSMVTLKTVWKFYDVWKIELCNVLLDLHCKWFHKQDTNKFYFVHR